MPHTASQTFLRELDKKLWTAADKKGAQASRLSLEDGKDTGKMPVLHYKITSTGKLIGNALEPVEEEDVRNDDLRIASSSSRRWSIRRSSLPNLAGLIDLIATIPFQHADLHAIDILGHDPNSASSDFASASLRDLCASAVHSPLPKIVTGMSPLPDTFTRDPHPDLRADFVMVNPRCKIDFSLYHL